MSAARHFLIHPKFSDRQGNVAVIVLLHFVTAVQNNPLNWSSGIDLFKPFNIFEVSFAHLI